MARFYSNENFPLPVVASLRALGHDVKTSLEEGNANRKIPDEQVLAFAVAEARSVLTLNRRDFFRIQRSGIAHHGIIACTADADYEGQANRIDQAVRAMADLAGQLLRINKPG